MYNSDQKEAFITAYSGSNKTQTLTRQIFNASQPYEESYHCDISLLTSEQLQPIVNELTGVRRQSAEPIVTILREYTKWRVRTGLEAGRGIFDVRVEAYEKIRDQMVSSPLHLKSKLDDVFDPPEKNTVDCVYRVFLWLAFSGFTDQEASRIKTSNVHLDSLYIAYKGHKYEIYQESIEDFRRVCNSTKFLYEHKNPHYTLMRDRAPGDIILRGFRSRGVNIKTIRPVITDKLKSYSHDASGNKIRNGYKLSYKRLYLSGVFYRAYTRERAGFTVDFSDLIDLEMSRAELDKKYTLNKNRTIVKISNAMAKEYMADYVRWKTAFDV